MAILKKVNTSTKPNFVITLIIQKTRANVPSIKSLERTEIYGQHSNIYNSKMMNFSEYMHDIDIVRMI